MPRGRLLKTIVREAREVAKAKVIGAEKGQLQVDKVKYNLNNIGLQVKKRLLELDPSIGSKMIATVGVAMALKKGIDWTQVVVGEYLWLGSYSSIPFMQFLGINREVNWIEGKTGEKDEINVGADIAEWLIAYGLAYLIVENFGEIVVALGTGLTSIVGLGKSLLGAGLVPV